MNADGLATKQHELRLRLNDDSIDICLFQETKLLPEDTTPSVPGVCAIRADRPTTQRGAGLLTLIRDDLVFQKTGEEYNPALERLAVQVQLSHRKWATIHNIYAAPIRSAGITDTLDFARLQMGHLSFLGGDLNAHSPLCDTNQPSDAGGEQVENWMNAHSSSVLKDGTATLLNRATVGLSSPDVSLAHPFLADKAEWTVGEDLGSDHLPITIELRCQTPMSQTRIRGPGGTPRMLTDKRPRKRLKNQCAPSKCKI